MCSSAGQLLIQGLARSHRYPRITIRAERRYLHAVVAEAWSKARRVAGPSWR
jgi:hypothetical protein